MQPAIFPTAEPTFKSVAKRRALWQTVPTSMGKRCAVILAAVFLTACGSQPGESQGAAPGSNSQSARATATAAAPEPLARIHFAGVGAIERSGMTTLRNVLALPETTALRTQALTSLAQNLTRSFPNDPAGAAQLVRPLLDDLSQSEWRVEAFENKGAAPLCLLAINSKADRAATWSTNLWSVASKSLGAAPAAGQLAGLQGWQARGGSHYLGFFRKGDWSVVVSSPAEPKNPEGLLGELSRTGRPGILTSNAFLSLDLATSLLPSPRLKGFSRLALNFAERGEFVRTTGGLTLAQPFNGRIEKWQIPTNTIRQRLVSFTAIQNTAGWLKEHYGRELPLDRFPNQLFLWSDDLTPFSSFITANVGPADAFIKKLAAQRVPEWDKKLEAKDYGSIEVAPTNSVITWSGLPIATPFIRPGAGADRDYVQAGLFPSPIGRDPVPPELLQQVTSRTNLLYYDWEITAQRLAQLLPVRQLYLLMTANNIPDPRNPAEQWLTKVQNSLGNTITQGSLDNPRTVGILRQSHIGLNGLEATALALWLQSTNFPRLQLDLMGKGTPLMAPPAARPGRPASPPPQ